MSPTSHRIATTCFTPARSSASATPASPAPSPSSSLSFARRSAQPSGAATAPEWQAASSITAGTTPPASRKSATSASPVMAPPASASWFTCPCPLQWTTW